MAADGDRIRFLLDHFNLSQSELARRLGCTRQFVNDILAGRTKISRELAGKIEEVFTLDLLWVLTGKGGAWGDGTTTTTLDGGPFAQRIEERRYRCSICLGFVAKDDEVCPTCGRRFSE